MTSHGRVRDRELSISSERTLDNIDAIPSVITTPIHSPGSMDNLGYHAGDSRPPHRSSPQPEGYAEEYQPNPPSVRVSWKEPSVTEVSPVQVDKDSSQFSYSYTGEPTDRTGHRHMPQVVTGTDSSPVRRLKKKENEQPQYTREVSDAHIDSISRTPRYGFGRENTYDELLQTMSVDDPFKGDYKPSGKSPYNQPRKPPRKEKKIKKDRSPSVDRDGTRDYLPLESPKRRKKKRKAQVDESKENMTSSFQLQANTNPAFNAQSTKGKLKKPVEADKVSVTSNGTYTLKDQLRASLTNLAAPILKRKANKIKPTMLDSLVHKHEEIDEVAFAKFVKDHIIQRECSSYVLNKTSAEGHCFCGRTREWHEIKFHQDLRANMLEEDKHIWHHKTHTEKLPCDSFGEIQFQGFQETSNSPYIRLSPCSDLEVVWQLLTETWKLPIPKLLISVTGGAQRFDLSPKLKMVFKKGLINAATSTGAWIITGGTATGVMQFVGEAVRDHQITLGSNDTSVVAIGVPTWGCIANRQALDGEGDEGLFPATYSFEDVEEVQGKDVPLDHNHTHFLLVDDGREGKFGGEIEFRASLERYVSEKVETGVAETQSVNVPVVMLVVEGGVNTMTTVWQAAQRNIPVLILNGSGRAADFIAYGYDISKDIKNEDKSIFKKSFESEMAEVAEQKFSWKKSDNKQKKIMEAVKQLKDMLEMRKLINVFNLSEADTKDIDRAILYALLKANKTNAAAQLALALAWNRCDIARHEIFTMDNRHHSKKLSLYDAMFTALVQDRVDFVQLFMENGVNLKKFLSIETLWNLYGNILKDPSDTMSQTMNNMLLYLKQSWKAYLCCRPTETTGQDPNLLFLVGKLLVHLVGDENMNHYSEEKYVVHGKTPEMRWLPGSHQTKVDSFGGTISKYTSRESSKKFYKRKRVEYDFGHLAERELFYWAILLNRREMGKMFWRSGDDQMGAALIACSILQALSVMADDDEELELSQDLLDHANMYEDMAYGVLSECYKRDKKMAHQLLVRRLESFGKATLFSLADANTLMKFMGHTCCQTKLNLIWKGRMALYTQTWKILLSLALPVFVPMIKFTTNQSLIDDHILKDDFDDLDDDSEEKVKDEVIESPKVKEIVKRPRDEDPEDDDEVFVKSKSRRKKAGKKKLYKVQMFSDTRTNSIGVLDAYYFFYTAPVTVFTVNTVSYIVFLGLFTYFLLTNFHPHTPSAVEYVTWGWTITMAIEELRQILSNDKRSLWYKLRSWFGSMWNKFDMAMYMIFVLSVILRYWLTGDKFVYARVFYSITLAMYYMRFMQTFFVEKNIGPKVIMIRNMIVDLMFFLGIVLVFMLSFGVMYQANLFPNSPPSWNLLKSVIYIPYWQMYGELFLEDMEGESPEGCTTNESIWRPNNGDNRCPEKNALVPFLAAVYLILTNILLVNLLIAMFSYTFQMVQDKSEQVWRYYRYSLVHEFYQRPVFCPPLIILNHVYRSFQWIARKGCSGRKYHNEFKLTLDPKDNNRLTLFVKSATEAYLTTTHKAAKEELGYKVSDTAVRIEKVIEELDHIKEQVRFSKYNNNDADALSRPGTAEPLDYVDHIPLSSRKHSKLESTVELLEQQMSTLSEQVAHTNFQASQMMQMMQMVLAQQHSRPHQLEISDINQYGEPENDRNVSET